jgi:hypothetical protein
VKRVLVTVALSALISVLALGLSGCGSSSHQPIIVTLTPTSTHGVDQAQTLSLTATVMNDTKSAGVTWTLSGGATPGTLSNQTTTTATYNAPAAVASVFTVSVTATSVSDTTKTASLQIKVSPPPTVTTSLLPAATAGTPYNQTLSESGGTSPYTWTIASGGSLPPGLSLNSSNGAITGTPTGGGSGQFTFQLTDAAKATATSQPIPITVGPASTLGVATASLPAGTTGTAYSQTLQASGGVAPYQWTSTGSLPAGLSLSSAGVISGTPTATGTSQFTVTATDSGTPTPQTASASLSITIGVGPLQVTTTSSSLPQAVVNGPYSATVKATGGLTPYTWRLSGNPAWLTINSSTGVLAGTPTAAGTTPNFTLTVTDSENPADTATANLAITVNATLSITTQSLPGGSVGTAYSAPVQANGGVQPYKWTISSGNLPAGLAINSGGTISGTPSAMGTSNFTVQVTDSESPNAVSVANLSIVIASASCPNNPTLTGNYALVLRGWSSLNTVTAAVGSFVADGSGNISGGSLDVDDQGTGANHGTFTGTYCVSSDNLATVTLTYGGALSGSNVFEAALDASDGNGHIIFYDNSSFKASGLLRRQDTSTFATSQITGNYAFGFAGADGSLGGAPPRFAVAGQFNVNNGSLTGSYDSDIYGRGIVTDQSLSSGDLSVLSATTGRGTAAITFNSSIAEHGTLNFVFYVVSATELLVMEDDAAGSSLLTGQVLQQSGAFTEASLNGVSVIELESYPLLQPSITAGLLTTTGDTGTFTFSSDQNLAGATSSQPTQAGNFNLSSYPNGRVTLSGESSAPVLYLIDPNQGFVVGTDTGVSFGFMWAQSGTSFTNASLSGTYLGGGRQPVNANVDQEVDSISADGQGNLTGTSDTNSSGGPATTAITDTYTVSSNGRVVVNESGTEAIILYIVSGTQAIALPTQDSAPKLIDFHQ